MYLVVQFRKIMYSFLFLVSANKRKRANPEMLEPLPPPQSPECRSVHSQPSPLYPGPLNSYMPQSPSSHGGSSAKKARVLFSEEQKEALSLAFQLDPYPSTVTIDFLASELNLSARTITNWFHNHRMRLKQQQGPLVNGNSSHDSDNSKSPTSTTPPPLRSEGLKFDPLHFRMLLNQRLLDIHKTKNAAFVNSVAQMAYPFYYDSMAAAAAAHALYLKQAEQTTTLDLSMGTRRQSEGEKSDSQDDSRDGMPSSAESGEDSDAESSLKDKDRRMAQTPAPTSSRRKPAAPQWVYTGLDLASNTTEEDIEAGSEDSDAEEIINGVCVRQTGDFGIRPQLLSEEMIRIEPAPVPDQDDKKHRDTKLNEKVTCDPSPIESLPPKLSERQNQLEKLQERLQGDEEEEDWEFW